MFDVLSIQNGSISKCNKFIKFTTCKIKISKNKETGVTIRLSSNMNVNINNEISFPHKLLLIDKQVSKVFPNNLSAKIKLSKTQLSKLIQSSGVLDRLLCPLLKMVYI